MAIYYCDSVSHSGIKGMHWGQRRWQNEDGSLTPEGRVRYGAGQSSLESYMSATTNPDRVRRVLKYDYKDQRLIDNAKYAEAKATAKAKYKEGKLTEEAYKRQLARAKKNKIEDDVTSKLNYEDAFEQSVNSGAYAVKAAVNAVAGVGLGVVSKTAKASGAKALSNVLKIASAVCIVKTATGYHAYKQVEKKGAYA